jgi:hypothetical protein
LERVGSGASRQRVSVDVRSPRRARPRGRGWPRSARASCRASSGARKRWPSARRLSGRRTKVAGSSAAGARCRLRARWRAHRRSSRRLPAGRRRGTSWRSNGRGQLCSHGRQGGKLRREGLLRSAVKGWKGLPRVVVGQGAAASRVGRVRAGALARRPKKSEGLDGQQGRRWPGRPRPSGAGKVKSGHGVSISREVRGASPAFPGGRAGATTVGLIALLPPSSLRVVLLQAASWTRVSCRVNALEGRRV